MVNAVLNGTVDISTYNCVSFFITSPNANVKATVKLVDYVGAVEHGAQVKLSDYVATSGSTMTWQQVIIPLAAFQRDNATLDLTKIKTLLLSEDFTNGSEYDTAGMLYIDDAKFSLQHRAPSLSKIYNGADKGTAGADDMPGDVLVWWDQAPSTQTTNQVSVRVSTGFAAAWVGATASSGTVAAGATTYFPFAIRNDGNCADRIVFSTVSTAGSAAGWAATVFYDRDQNRAYSAGDAICWDTIGLLPDSTHYFLVGINAPGTAVNGQFSGVQVTAKDAFGAGTNDVWPTGANDDTLVLVATATCAGPNISVVKSTNVAVGLPGITAVTYTISITNSGNVAASNVVLTDVVPLNMVMTGAATSVGGATITYFVGSSWTGTYSASATKIRWTWASIAAGGGTASGQFTTNIK
jgi:uncharacterized repeat protein (TIGR01451 family)